MAESSEVSEALSVFLRSIEDSIEAVSLENYFILKEFQSKLESSEYVLLVIEEYDMPQYHIYTFDVSETKVEKIVQFYDDGLPYDDSSWAKAFDPDEDYSISIKSLGFNNDQSLFEYEY